MVTVAADLAQFVQRRELLAYEQRVARAAYAYGVDLRRAAWLDHSTLGEPLMRTVDRKWTGLVQELAAEDLLPADVSPPDAVLEELSRMLRLLRAPLPTLRLLRPERAQAWPIVTPLGTTRGGCHWLVVDLDRLLACKEEIRTFVLGAALGNLQCDHGPMFAAHLMAHRGRGFSMVRSLLKPWSRVAAFSADRAGLLATGELEPALEALREEPGPEVAWMPISPPLELRIQALQDFDRSRVMTRLRLLFPQRSDWTVAPSHTEPRPEEPAADSPAPEAADAAKRETRAPASPSSPSPARPGPKLVEDVVEQAEREAEKIEHERAEAESKQDAEAEEKAKADQIAKAWPLARCDARLTRRLGIL